MVRGFQPCSMQSLTLKPGAVRPHCSRERRRHFPHLMWDWSPPFLLGKDLEPVSVSCPYGEVMLLNSPKSMSYPLGSDH